MKRLIKKSQSTKWTVSFNAEDGFYQEPFDTKQQAIEYMEKQTGFDLKDKTDNELKNIIDNYGRSFELSMKEYNDCQVCGKKDVPTVTIEGTIKACYDCWDDYECGGWEIKDGKVLKNKPTSWAYGGDDEMEDDE